MTELKRINFSKGSFEANGTNYIIETGFSIERYAMYQKLQIETGFNVTFETMFQSWETVVQKANELKFSEIVIMAYDISRGMQQIEEKEPLVLKMCALFINAPDEDRRTITDDMISKKIRDWKEGGYDMADFFQLALNTINGFMSAWRRLSQTISESAKLNENEIAV